MSERVPVPARTDDRIRVRHRRRKRWWRRRRVRRGVLIGLGVLAGAAILDGAWAANSAVRGLIQVRHQLEAAAEDLMTGRIDQALIAADEVGMTSLGKRSPITHH